MNSKDIANYLLEDSNYLFEAKVKETSAPTKREMTPEEVKYYQDIRANAKAIRDLEDKRAAIVVKGLKHSTKPEQEAELDDIRAQIKALEAQRSQISDIGLKLAAARKAANVTIDLPSEDEQASFLDRHADALQAIKDGTFTKSNKSSSNSEEASRASKGPAFNAAVPKPDRTKEELRAVVANSEKGEKGVGDKDIKLVRKNIDPTLLVLAAAHQINKDTVALHGKTSKNELGELFPHKRTSVAVLDKFVIPYEAKKIDVPDHISSTDEEFAAKIWKDLQATRNAYFKDFFSRYFDGTRVTLGNDAEMADEFVERIAQYVTERNSEIVSFNKTVSKDKQKPYYIPTYTLEIAADLKKRLKELGYDNAEERKERYERLTKEQKEKQTKLIDEMKESLKDDYLGKPGEKVTFKIAKIVKINIASKEVVDVDESRLAKGTKERLSMLDTAMAFLNKAAKDSESVDESMEEIADYISEADTPEPVQRHNDSEIMKMAAQLAKSSGHSPISKDELKTAKKEPVYKKLSYRELMNQRRERQIASVDNSIKAIERNEKVNAVIINVYGITTTGKAFRLKLPWVKGLDKEGYIDKIFSKFPDFEKIVSRGKRQAFAESEYSIDGTPEVTATVYFAKNIVKYNSAIAESSDNRSKLLKSLNDLIAAADDLEVEDRVSSNKGQTDDEKRHDKNIKSFSSQLAVHKDNEDDTVEKKFGALSQAKLASVGKNSDVARNSKQIYTILDQREAGLERLSVAELERFASEPNLFRGLTDLTLDYDKTGKARDTEETAEKEVDNEYSKLNREIIDTVAQDANFPIPKKGNIVKTNFASFKSTKFFNNKDEEGNALEGQGTMTFIGLTKEGVFVNGSVEIDSPVLSDLFVGWDKNKYLEMSEEEKKAYIPKPTGKVTNGKFSKLEIKNRKGNFPIKTQRMEKDGKDKNGKDIWKAVPTKTLNDLMDLRNRTDELSLMLKLRY